MKKKIKSKDLHEVVEKLQQRVEDLENQQILMLKQLGRLQSQCEEA